MGCSDMNTLSEQKPQTKRFLRRADVERATGFSGATLYRLAALGRFPKPMKIGARASAWLESEVQAWVDARIAERDNGEGGAR